jgi:hypothetical protein
VEESHGDDVLISYTTPEGWVSTFLAHRHMMICQERHQGVMDFCQDELLSISQRIAHSPMLHVAQETAARVSDEGLMVVGADAIQGVTSVFSRWMQNGIGAAVNDIAFATNWDGRFNPDAAAALSEGSLEETTEETAKAVVSQESSKTSEALPNMPACPITGEPMRDPVVAADGHTYERVAIARWFTTSDISPLTGSVVSHKNLVPNYMLLSSLQESASLSNQSSEVTPEILIDQAFSEDDVTPIINVDPPSSEEDATTEINLDPPSSEEDVTTEINLDQPSSKEDVTTTEINIDD